MYTAKKLPNGNYEVYENGQRVTTGAASILANFGLSPTNLGGGSSQSTPVKVETPTYTPPQENAQPSGLPQTNLKPGDRSPEVTQLQNWLIQNGYSIPAGATGFYGDQTKSAVAQLQAKLGIQAGADAGFFGPKTMAAIGGSQQQNPQEKETPQNSETPSMYDGLIKGSPFLTEQLQDPAKKAQFDSLPEDLKMIYLQTATSLGKAIEAGKVVNPNIKITPEENAKLLEQARSELDPYYQEKLDGLKGDFQTSISRLMEDFNKSATREVDKFKGTLETQAESEAQAGTVYSSGRNDRERRTVNLEQNALDDAFTTTTRNAQDKANAYEKNVGSAGIRSLDIPSVVGYNASNTGLTPSSSRSLYSPMGNIAIGEIGKQKTVDTEARRSQLEGTLRTNRILDTTSF